MAKLTARGCTILRRHIHDSPTGTDKYCLRSDGVILRCTRWNDMSPFGPWKVYSRAVVGRSEKDQREGYGRLLKSLEKYGTVQEVDK